MNRTSETKVRLKVDFDFQAEAVQAGLRIGTSLITWGWLEEAKKAVTDTGKSLNSVAVERKKKGNN